MRLRISVPVLLICLVAACVGHSFAAGREEGRAREIPWSGYWWPHHEGAILGPLGKYDTLTQRRAEAWERKNHPSGPGVPKWFGYCHAWAAAAVLDPEPTSPRTIRRQAGQPAIALQVGDQKGLISVCHASDVANSYGERFSDGDSSDDRLDLAPDALWRLLKLYVKQQGVPLILDVEAGNEVWNYPIYAYQIDYRRLGSSNKHAARLILWMADDAVPPDFVGVKVRRHTYEFTVQMRSGSVVMGSGRWTGPSAKDHPDFAWYPYVVKPENPELEYNAVKQLLGQSESLSENDPTDAQPPNTDPPTVPTEPSRTEPAAPNVVSNDQPVATQPDARHDPEEVRAVSPLELVALVTNNSSSFKLDVTVDRFDGAIYRPGESFSIKGSSERAGFLYLLHIDSRGELTLLYPQAGQDNRISAGRRFEIPGPKDRVGYRVLPPAGINRVKAIVTTKRLLLPGLMPPIQKKRPLGNQVRSKDLRRSSRQAFRWHPTLRNQVRDLLIQYNQEKALPAGKTGVENIEQILGEFAQDEVAFYVEEKAKNGK